MPGIFKSRIFAGKQKPFDAIHHLCSVKFLDNSEGISFTYQRNTKGRFLVDHVCSSINLIEKDYFGLKYTDAEKQECWLDPEKTIYSQIKGLSNPVLYFQVRFYPSDLNTIKEEITRYQLFLQVRKDFNDQRLICSLQDALLLTAYIVQEELGDYNNQSDDWHQQLSRIKLPPSMLEYESYILVLHQQLKGLSQSDAEYKFLEKTASLSSYGIDPYVVSDDKGYQMYLTVAPKGLITFEDNLPTRTYHWRSIGKLSFDGKSFHIRLDDREKGSGGRAFKNHLNTSLFACTSAKQKPKQQTTSTYKCLSHTNCKQLWKNSMAYKYFYTLQSSSEAPKVLSSGGLFSRGSKFRYSGSCLAETRRSSASINREEPRVTRHLSNVHINEDNRYSTLPKKWKADSSYTEDARDAKETSSEAQVNESSIETEKLIRRTSSDSALGTTPANADLKSLASLPRNDTGESKGEFRKEVEKAKESEFIESVVSTEQNFILVSSGSEDVSSSTIASVLNGTAKINVTSEKEDRGQGDDVDDVDKGDVEEIDKPTENCPNINKPAIVSNTCEVATTDPCSFVDSVASSIDCNLKEPLKSTELSSNLQSIDRQTPLVHSNVTGDLSINSSRDDSTEMPSEEGSFHESMIQPRIGMKAVKRKRQESGSGYDTGYMSSGSERLSRSFESEDHANDVNALKNNGIVEEMEFPTSDGILPGNVERIEDGMTSDSVESQEFPLSERKPNVLVREELLSMLSYASEDLSSFSKMNSSANETLKQEEQGIDEGGRDENADLTPTTSLPPGDFLSSVSSSYPSFFESIPKATADQSDPFLSPSAPPSSIGYFTSFGSGHSLTSGVFSSDNFKRIKEIEQMIEDNKSKIQLMKQTITSEIKKSRSCNVSRPTEPGRSDTSPLHADDMAYLKQPKHVSFSSQRTEWYHREKDQPLGNLKSWFGMEAINGNNDDISSVNYQPIHRSEEIVELIVPRVPRTDELANESKVESSGVRIDTETSEFVEKVPAVSSEGTFVAEVELCKCSDDGHLDEDGINNCAEYVDGNSGNSDKDNSLESMPGRSDTTCKIPKSSSGTGNSSTNISSESSRKSPRMEKRFEQFTFSETVVEEVVKITPEVFRSLSAEFHLPTPSNLATTPVAQNVDVITCESTLNSSSEQSLITSEMSSDDLVPAVEWGKECSGTKEFLMVSEESSTSSTSASSRGVMKSICKGTGVTLLSVMLSLLVLATCLVIIFELDQEIPYVTDQEAVLELRKSFYEPAREQVVKYFQK